MSEPAENLNSNAKWVVEQSVSDISAFDELEKEHIEDTLAWIRSGAPIFRVAKPDIPKKHSNIPL